MEEMEFTRCYRRLIVYYRLSAETNGSQLAEILRRLHAQNVIKHSSEGTKIYPTGRGLS